MGKLVTLKLDVTKIPKDRIFVGKQGKYIDLDIWINDDPDQYGNDASANIQQTAQERERKERKIYVGNGKKVFGFDSTESQESRRRPGSIHPKKELPPPNPTDDSLDQVEEDDIPF